MQRSVRKFAAIAIAIASAACLAGCQTTEGARRIPVAALKQPPSTGQPLPTDIREILAAGGLDATNPSAPAPRPTAIAAADIKTSPATEVVEVPAVPPSRQVILAARDATPAPVTAAPVIVATASPARPAETAVAKASEPDVATVLASLGRPKKASTSGVIAQHASSYAAAEIEAPPVVLASINVEEIADAAAADPAIPAPKARAKAAKTVSPKPEVRTADANTKKPVRRF